MKPVFPLPLRTGDTIGIIAPAGVVDAVKLDRAVQCLHDRGFKTKTYRDVLARRGYLAGDDAARAAEINAAFADPACGAIFPARGGYGCLRMVDQIDFHLVRANPKIFLGFSDNTVLQSAFWREAGLVTFHGPHPSDSYGRPTGPTAKTEKSLWHLLLGDPKSAEAEFKFETCETFRPGNVEGRLVGGNLALVCSLLGTPYEIDFENNVLLLEDTDEPPYRVDRFLAQLKLAGCLEKVAGILLGEFTRCQNGEAAAGLTLSEVLADHLSPFAGPILAGFPAGHGEDNVTLPLGARVRLDADRRTLTLLESPTR
jgi:muramoyltetrapeptide carboxypeptidase